MICVFLQVLIKFSISFENLFLQTTFLHIRDIWKIGQIFVLFLWNVKKIESISKFKKLYLFSNLPSGFVFSIWIGQLWTRSRPKKEEKISFLKLGGGAATSNSCWESSSPPIFTIIILSTRRHNVFESGHHSFRPTGISFSKAEKCLKVFRWL